MKSSNIFRKSMDVLSKSHEDELQTFNRRRAARGLLPVTQEEYNELSLKMVSFGNWGNQIATVH